MIEATVVLWDTYYILCGITKLWDLLNKFPVDVRVCLITAS